jgi:serine/threonine protein kinase
MKTLESVTVNRQPCRTDSGASGKVYKVATPTGQLAALKKVNLSARGGGMSAEAERLFRRECEVLSRLRHPAIIRVIGFEMPAPATESPSGSIVTEWMPHESLAAKGVRTLTATQRIKIALGIAKGMAYTHACGIIHRDVKPENVLLDERFAPRIADSGIAKIAAGLTETQLRGTHLYMSPDLRGMSGRTG